MSSDFFKSEVKVISIIVRIIVVGLILWAYTEPPIAYYTFLQFIVFTICAFGIYFATKTKQTAWILLMVIVAVLFNPIIPIYLKRDLREFYYAITILILLLSIPSLRLSSNDNTLIDKYREPIKTIIWSIVLIVGALVFWHHIVGNPLDELALIQRAELATGVLVDSYEVEHESDRGVYISEVGVYSFTLPDGREFKTFTKNSSGEREEQIEYLPDNPSVNRVRWDGCQTLMEWLWRKVILGGILLILFVYPGFYLMFNGIKEIKNTVKSNNSYFKW
jgi:hypothetical protein